jgi:N-acetylgalactosamine kinase
MALSYGADSATLHGRSAAVVRALDRFLEAFGDLPCMVYRAPARLSLNPHVDHQGAWVPYGLHVRELVSVVAPTDDDRVEVTNVDPSFTPLLSFSVSDEIARDPDAWKAGWFQYLESPAVVAEVQRNLDSKTQTTDRRATINYIKCGALRLRHAHPDARLPGLRMSLHGNIMAGGGQSSSSALVVTTTLALGQFANLTLDRRLLAELCGEAEWYVGTRGGSGDHAAILLGTRSGLTHLCFRAPFGIRGVRHSAFPVDHELIVANSQTRSEKSAEEKLLFNRGIFAYRFAFLALKQQMEAIGLPLPLIEETASLGDLHAGRLAQADLYRLIRGLPGSVSPAELAARFPQTFGTAARGCFGTDDPDLLPAKIPLRGAAVYGLGRVDRGRVMPDLLETGDDAAMREFGWLITVTHDGDRLFRGGEPYTENRDSLADFRIERLLSEAESGEDRPLRYEPGFYGASIAELDRMVDVSLRTEGVLGAGLMGAGGGGYILALARRGTLDRLREALERDYYTPLQKKPDVEAWNPTSAACRVH